VKIYDILNEGPVSSLLNRLGRGGAGRDAADDAVSTWKYAWDKIRRGEDPRPGAQQPPKHEPSVPRDSSADVPQVPPRPSQNRQPAKPPKKPDTKKPDTKKSDPFKRDKGWDLDFDDEFIDPYDPLAGQKGADWYRKGRIVDK